MTEGSLSDGGATSRSASDPSVTDFVLRTTPRHLPILQNGEERLLLPQRLVLQVEQGLAAGVGQVEQGVELVAREAALFAGCLDFHRIA